MGEFRHWRAQSLIHEDLARRVVDMIVAADHVGDAHVDVIHHHHEVVGRRAVGTLDDDVVQFGDIHRHRTLNEIIEGYRSLVGGTEPHHIGHSFGMIGSLAAGAVVFGLAPLLHCQFALGVQLLRRAVATVGLALVQQLLHLGAVQIHALGLEEGPLVPGKAQPLHGGHDFIHVLLGGTLGIGILNPEHEGAAVMAGKQIVEQRRAGTADMQIARGAGGKTNTNVCHVSHKLP